VLRADPLFRELVEDDPDLTAWLRGLGLHVSDWDLFEPRGGSHRYHARPARDHLHLERGGSHAEEAKRWNADLAHSRLIDRRPISISDGRGLEGSCLAPESFGGRFPILPPDKCVDAIDLGKEFGGDELLPRVYLEYVAAGATDHDVDAREIRRRRRRWNQAPLGRE
jgi:hypothetical protein